MSNSYKFYSDTKDIMKKYVNATEGAIIYGISKSRIMVLASEAGAVYKVGNSALINTDIFEMYLEKFKEPTRPLPKHIWNKLSSEDKNPIASLIVSQQYELLAEAADRRGGRLERRVNFILDEYGNFTPISDMTNKLTVAAGRGMRYALFVLQKLVEKAQAGGELRGYHGASRHRGGAYTTVHPEVQLQDRKQHPLHKDIQP